MAEVPQDATVKERAKPGTRNGGSWIHGVSRFGNLETLENGEPLPKPGSTSVGARGVFGAHQSWEPLGEWKKTPFAREKRPSDELAKSSESGAV